MRPAAFWNEILDCVRGESRAEQQHIVIVAALCLLTLEMMRLAASNSCYLDFPIVINRILELEAIIDPCSYEVNL